MKTLLLVIAAAIVSLNSPISFAKGKLNQLTVSNQAAVASKAVSQTININTADAAQLASVLKGIGLKKGQAIVAYRNKFGDFKSIDELTAVKGVGEKTVAKNRAKISL